MQSIAVVNNEKNLAQMLAMNLRAAGYEVRAYHRSDEALHALSERPADLALIDRTNPPLGGIELFRRLRRHTAMPVVFLSAWAREVAQQLAGSGLEAEGYIDIPMSYEDVRATVRAVLAPLGPAPDRR
jgi:two-component system response regulator ChvI